MSVFSDLYSLFVNIKKDNCYNNAAVIAYFFLLSFFPMLFLVVTTVGFFTGSNVYVIKEVYAIVSNYVPNLNYDIWLKLTGWVAKTNYGLNTFSVVMLLFSSTLVFKAIDRSLRDIFADVNLKKRSRIKTILVYWLAILFLLAMVFMFMAVDVSYVFLKKLSRTRDYIFLKPLIRHMNFLFALVPILMQVATLMFIFRSMLGRGLSSKKMFASVVFIVFMWIMAIEAFTWYVTSIPTYNVIYGSMSIFIILITWSYYSSFIFLVGAEILKLLVARDRRPGT